MQTRKPFQPHPDSTCAKVIAFAKQRNSRELMRMQRDGYALDEQSSGRDAVSYLAESGDFETANYLIDRFYASKASLMHGAAVGGFDHVVESVLEAHIEADLERRRNEANGGAESRHKMRARLESNLKLMVSFSYALGGHTRHVSNIWNQFNGAYGFALVKDLIYHYALNGSCQDEIDGYYARLDALAETWSNQIKTNVDVITRDELRDELRNGFDVAIAKAGYQRQGLKYSSKIPLSREEIIHACAKGGHESDVFALLEQMRLEAAQLLNDSKARAKSHGLKMMTDEFYGGLLRSALYFSADFSFKVLYQYLPGQFMDISSVFSYLRTNPSELRQLWLAMAKRRYYFNVILRDRWHCPLDQIEYVKHQNKLSEEQLFQLRDETIKEWLTFIVSGEWTLKAALAYERPQNVSQDVITAVDAEMSHESGKLMNILQSWLHEKCYLGINKLYPAFSDEEKQLRLDTWKGQADRVLAKYQPHEREFAAASIDDDGLRYFMLEYFGMESLKNKFQRVNTAMRNGLLDFHCAMKMVGMREAAYHWLTVCYALPIAAVNAHIFIDIAALLMGVNSQDARAIYEVLLKTIFERQPPGMCLQGKLDVFGLFKPTLRSGGDSVSNLPPSACLMN